MATYNQMWPNQTSAEAEVYVHIYIVPQTSAYIYHFILVSNLSLLDEYIIIHL